MDDDPELVAIRAKLRAQIMGAAAGTPSPAPSPAPSTSQPVDLEEADVEAFVRSHPHAVVDCWAPWCGPCRIVGPIVDDLAREMAGRVAFGKLNVDLAPRLSQALGIQSIPTLLLFQQGRLVDRVVGALPKLQLAAQIDRVFSRRGSPGPRRL